MKYFHLPIFVVLLISCSKDDVDLAASLKQDTETAIYVSDDIIIDDRVKINDNIFNYNTYENFISELVNSNRYIFVPLNEFEQTFSTDKVVISMRHDIDYDVASAVRFARREFKHGVRATYYFLHSADYYGSTLLNSVTRNPSVLKYMSKIQNQYKHEIGLHNDLVTLQAVYKIDVKKYLTDELDWIRQNEIKIDGTSFHGSEFCYKYHYLNSYIWEGSNLDTNFSSFESVRIDGTVVPISKLKLSDFGFKYEAGRLNYNYFFADAFYVNGKRWNMGMIDWSTLKPGDKVIVLTHSALWN